MNIQSRPQSPSGLTQLLLTCGLLAGPFFTLAWLWEGATRADYDALRHPISSLSIGEFGWTQAANFFITGFLLLAFAAGLGRVLQGSKKTTRAPFLIGLLGVGLIGAGIFVTDPMNGYPLGTPNLPLQYSLAGRMHRLFSAFVFVGLPVACFLFARLFAARGKRKSAAYSRATGIAFLLMFVLTSIGFGQVGGLANIAGLLQRLTLTIGFAWLTWLAWYGLDLTNTTFGQARPPA